MEIFAPAFVDIASCWAGVITRSAVPISDHEGIVSQAGGPDGSANWAAAAGRWVADNRAVCFGLTPLAKHSAKPG